MPAIIFDRLPEDHIVQMFVTINAKHTRLNASHLVSLSGRQLCGMRRSRRHDAVRALNDREDSPPGGQAVGVGRGRVAQAPLAQELKLFASDAFGGPRKSADFREDSRKFFVNYFKQVAVVFGAAWNGRSRAASSPQPPCARSSACRPMSSADSTRTMPSEVIFVQLAESLHRGGASATSASRQRARGTQRATVDSLARELKLALEYPEGAGV